MVPVAISARSTPRSVTRLLPMILSRHPMLTLPLFSLMVWASSSTLLAATHVVLMIGEYEYRTEKTLPTFFQGDLEIKDLKVTIIEAPPEGPERHQFTGLEDALDDANLLVLSVRRRAPTEAQLSAVRKYLASGRPLLGIRTASHAFDARGEQPAGHAEWLEFDRQVLGASYTGHYGDEPFQVELSTDAASHPVLRGVEPWSSNKLYKSKLVSDNAQELLTGTINGERQSVAWTHIYGERKARILYTSLGIESDFENPNFKRFMKNAVHWCLD